MPGLMPELVMDLSTEKGTLSNFLLVAAPPCEQHSTPKQI